MSKDKIKTLSQLKETVKIQKQAKKVIGFTNGCFDILHLGHVRYLSMAKKECDFLIVGVNSDESVKRLGKGELRPLNPEQARLEVLSSLESVDCVILFSEDTPEKLIREICPAVIFKGGDWDENKIAGASFVKELGGKVRIIPYVEGYSTTALIGKIQKTEDRESGSLGIRHWALGNRRQKAEGR